MQTKLVESKESGNGVNEPDDVEEIHAGGVDTILEEGHLMALGMDTAADSEAARVNQMPNKRWNDGVEKMNDMLRQNGIENPIIEIYSRIF